MRFVTLHLGLSIRLMSDYTASVGISIFAYSFSDVSMYILHTESFLPCDFFFKFCSEPLSPFNQFWEISIFSDNACTCARAKPA